MEVKKMTELQKMKKSNVVGFKNDSVYQAIDNFLYDKSERSKNTAYNYKRYYEEFFMFAIGKELKDLTWDDIINIGYDDVLMFRRYLRSSKKNSPKTANIKVIALRTLWTELNKINGSVDVKVVNLKPLREDRIDTQYGSLTEDEISSLFQFAEKQYSGLTQRMFFETAFVTGFRKQALLNLKWKNIKKRLDKTTNEEVWCICIKDKGKEVIKPISDDFYSRLIKLRFICHNNKGVCDKNNDPVFVISDKTLEKTLKKFCKEYGISEDRNIVIHSIKKASMDYVWNNTKDIVKTAQQGNHSTIEYAYNTYLGKNESYVDNPSYYLFDSDVDISCLQQLSKDEIIDVIMNCNSYVKKEIVNKITQ